MSKIKPTKVGKLEFDLSDPLAKNEMNLALNASSMGIIITELDSKLRAMIKYEDRTDISISEVRELLSDLVVEHYPGFYNDFN